MSSLPKLLADAVQPAAPGPAASIPYGVFPGDIADALYGSAYGEGEGQGMPWAQVLGQEPDQPPMPQIDDLQRLFNGTIGRNAGASPQWQRGI